MIIHANYKTTVVKSPDNVLKHYLYAPQFLPDVGKFAPDITPGNLYFQNKTQQNNQLHHQQSGFSLIEVMIAALVISFGMLGVAGLQLVGMKGSYQSYMRHQATFIMNDMVERMRANPVGVAASNYVFDTDDTGTIDCTSTVNACSSAGSDCNPQQIAAYDIYAIACGLGTSATEGIKTLNNGRLQVSCVDCANWQVQVEISWSERQIGNENAAQLASDATRTDNIILNTRISP